MDPYKSTTTRCGTINRTIDSSASRPALPWSSPTARFALAVIPGWITLAILVFNVGWPTKSIVGAVLALSFVSPPAGFLAAVAFAPFGHLVALAVSVENFRMSEAVVLAFFAGWLLHGWTDRDGPRMPRLIAPALAALVAGSVGGLAWQLGRHPGELPRTLDLLIHAYNMTDDRIGFAAGARLVEGLALAAATITLFRQRPQLAVAVPRVLAAAGAAAAGASWLLWYGIAPAAVLREHARNGYRVAAHVTDANAAGTAFAMLTCIALGIALRARERQRGAWLAVAAVNATGVWLSVSRSALVAGVAASLVIVGWWTAARLRSRPTGTAGAVLIVLAVLAGAGYLGRMSRDQLSRGGSFRAQFNATSVRMIAARPLTGVGIGQYYRESSLFLTPQLAWYYGSENAHNYFLQIAGELGVPGLSLFAALFGIALWRTGRTALRKPDDLRLVGLGCGVAVFLATSFVGQPFLIDEVALPFWVAFGLLLGLADSWRHEGVPPARGERTRPMLTLAAIALAVVLAPAMRVWGGELGGSTGPAVDGFYGWEVGADGARYRWSQEYASVFAPGEAARVDIPVRIPEGVRGLPAITVTPSLAGKHLRPVPVGPSWSVVEVEVPEPGDPGGVRRIDLRIDPAWQPALHIAGNGDMRRVGVQVGECRLMR